MGVSLLCKDRLVKTMGGWIDSREKSKSFEPPPSELLCLSALINGLNSSL